MGFTSTNVLEDFTTGVITGTSLTTATINNATGTVMQYNGLTKLQTLNTGVTVTGVITGTSLTTGVGTITGGAITGTSLTTGAGAITGGAISGTTISGTTSIQTPRSIIGSSNSSNNIITIAKRVTVITISQPMITITASGGESVSTYLELVASGAASGVGNASRYSFFNVSYPPPGAWTTNQQYTYQNGSVGGTPNYTFASSGATLTINMSTPTNTWTGTVFVKLWNGTGVPGSGSWNVVFL